MKEEPIPTLFLQAEFLRKLMIMMLHLVSISVAMYLRPEYDRTLMGTSPNDIARNCFELTTLLGCLYYLAVQSGSEIRNQGLVPFTIQLVWLPGTADMWALYRQNQGLVPFTIQLVRLPGTADMWALYRQGHQWLRWDTLTTLVTLFGSD